MTRNRRSSMLVTTCVVGAAILVGAIAIAQEKDQGQQPQLPKGWSEADMQACTVAGTPGEMHKKLARSVGTWEGACEMWMAPDSESMKSTTMQTITSVMDGRYIKGEFKGEIPGMGAFEGLGYMGYDNVMGKLVGTWIDNHSTGIMTGTGEMSEDGKTITWNYTYMCPIQKKPTTMREIDTFPDADHMTLEMFAKDPKSGKEYKCMHIEYTRKS